MSRKVVTASKEDSLASVMEVMLRRNISHIPVVDAERALVGIVSKTDIVSERALHGDTREVERPEKVLKRGARYRLEDGFHLDVDGDVTVGDVMTPVVFSIADTASLGEAAALMSARHVHGLPVVSKRRGLVGFISTADVTGWVARS